MPLCRQNASFQAVFGDLPRFLVETVVFGGTICGFPLRPPCQSRFYSPLRQFGDCTAVPFPCAQERRRFLDFWIFSPFSLEMPRFLPFLRLCLAFKNKFLCFTLPCLAFNRFNGFSLFLPSICTLCPSFFSLKRAVLYIEKAVLFHVKHFARFKRGISRFLRKQKEAL